MVEKWTAQNWQKTLFHIWLEVTKTRFLDVKESVCAAIFKLIQNNGHNINNGGWKTILAILHEVSQESGKTTQQGEEIRLLYNFSRVQMY